MCKRSGQSRQDTEAARDSSLTIEEVYKILEMIRSPNKLLRGSFVFYCGSSLHAGTTVNRVVHGRAARAVAKEVFTIVARFAYEIVRLRDSSPPLRVNLPPR